VLAATQQPVPCSLTDWLEVRQQEMRGCDKTEPVRAAADRRAAQHSARDRPQFYKYLMQAGLTGHLPATAHILLAELGFLIRTRIGYGPRPAQPSNAMPIARAQSTTAV